MHTPSISVVILTYKRQPMLFQTIRTVLQQDYPNFEVIVVDNHSADETPSLVQQEFPQVRCILLPQNLGAAGRNAGFHAAHGEIVVTIDNDIFLDSDQELSRLADLFQKRPRAGC